MNVDKFMETYKAELKSYKIGITYSEGFVLHIAPLGGSGYYIGTLTAYNKDGLKSEHAFPIRQYMRIIDEIESLLEECSSGLHGFKPTSIVKEFLYRKKAHRLFFLSESNVLPFIKTYMSTSRKADREERGIEVIVSFG